MRRFILLAVAAISAALFALPAVAYAGEWEIDPAGWAFTFTSAGNTVVKTTNNETFTCTGETGKGTYNAGSKTTGTLEMTLTGCSESILGTKCQTAGQPSGTITTTPGQIFTNVYLKDDKTTPGLTIRGTGTPEHLVSLECGGGLVKVKLSETYLGALESACNFESEEHKVEFKSIQHGHQRWTRVTETEPIEDVGAEITVFGGTTNRTASVDSTTILKSQVAGQKAKITCV